MNDASGDAEGVSGAFAGLEEALAFARRLAAPAGGTRLQGSPETTARRLGDELAEAGWLLSPSSFTHILSIVDLSSTEEGNAAVAPSAAPSAAAPAVPRPATTTLPPRQGAAASERPPLCRPPLGRRLFRVSLVPAALQLRDARRAVGVRGDGPTKAVGKLQEALHVLGLVAPPPSLSPSSPPSLSPPPPPPPAPAAMPRGSSGGSSGGSCGGSSGGKGPATGQVRPEEEEGCRGGGCGGGGRCGGLLALDIGASPGGWSAALLGSGAVGRVVGVDPAAMAPDVAALPGFTHVRALARHALETGALARAIAGGGCRGGGCRGGCGQGGVNSNSSSSGGGGGQDGPGRVDLLVCDMNQPPHRAAASLAALCPLLKPGGLVVMTLKYKGAGRERKAGGVEAVHRLLGAAVDAAETRCVWLLANTTRERCLVLKRSRAGRGQAGAQAP